MLLDHKMVVNNSLYSNYNEFKFNISSFLNNYQIKEEITVVKGNIVFPEHHYFHLIANLRKARFKIPLDFTLEYFISNIQTFIYSDKFSGNLVYTCVLSNSNIDHVVYEDNNIGIPNVFNAVEIYREDFLSNNLASLINFPNGFQHALNTYREENELDDLFLLNNSKFLVGSYFGNVFLIKGTELSTPQISDGAVDNAARNKFLSLSKTWPEFDSVVEKTINPFEITKSDECFILTPHYRIISVNLFRKTQFDHQYTYEIKKKLIALVQ